MKTFGLLYPIFDEPVILARVTDGLWRAECTRPDEGTVEQEYLRGVDIFTKSMPTKVSSIRDEAKDSK